MFRDHGRFADLASTDHQRYSDPTQHTTKIIPPETNKVPSLVSFVGQTGAGKSTLIKLLISINQWTGYNEKFHSPVPGMTGRDLPTSEDVHLYSDPLTAGSSYPILFADSEGLDGGEREPLAAALRKTREKEELEPTGSESDYSATPRNFTEREVSWMDSKMKRTRQFAAGQLYPRILFAFSDVVVFVHRNPR
jgi:energy-coupling factor transporter ATP-binding protein EcfA2